ncbi:hypothetical protein HRTV-28_gp8 [Halorubrum tailed virus 28]|uniref:Uncharacterized protein n=1 Tax=Halorubrum tailed virus 28 TaxID=2878009 RepID=A0AAE8XZM3_9CAUD|nr:hypothetical protein M1M39_gp09 [Halorubrum tailed virus 28]UBF23446.1 hypothetical protein HRTV-28_gp8 [Halorubrum tailed virus 28]
MSGRKHQTVGDLINALSEYDEDTPIAVDHEGVLIENVQIAEDGDTVVVY